MRLCRCLSFCRTPGLRLFGKAGLYAIERHPNSSPIPKSFQLIRLYHLRNTTLGNAERFNRARCVNFANSAFVGIDRDNNNLTAIFRLVAKRLLRKRLIVDCLIFTLTLQPFCSHFTGIGKNGCRNCPADVVETIGASFIYCGYH